MITEKSNYAAEMAEIVEPYLAARAQTVPLSRETGCPLYCACYMPEEPKGVIIISHGFTETAEKYREIIYYFLQEGYVVYIFEHCGHGRSYRLTEDLSRIHIDRYERYRDDLLCVAHAAIDAQPGLPLFLFAHSMGGGIGACAIAAAPDLFAGAVLTSPMIRPATGSFPWPVTELLCTLFCAVGKGERYAPGQGPYQPGERFEDSAGLSEPRFDYYQSFRNANEYAQMGGATYGWMNAAAKLSDFLLTEGWKTISCPILLFQADNDTFVMNAQQDEFIKKVQTHNLKARLIHVDNTKHEIFNSGEEVLSGYWEEIFRFCQKNAG